MELTDETIVVPDTNAFLEFTFFTDVDWVQLVGAKHVLIVITYPVLRELDKWKRERGRRRDRALQVLRRLRAAFHDGTVSEGDIRPNVRAVLWSDDIRDAAPHGGEDERLLAITQNIARRQPDHRVVLMTDDTSVLMKARVRGLEVMEMPDDLRLPPEPSQERRELQQLREKFEEFRTQLPVLELLADTPNGPSKDITLPIRVPANATGADIQARVEQESAPYAKILARLQVEPGRGTAGLSAILYRRPTGAELEKYRKELTVFQSGYPQHLERLHHWSRLRGRSNSLQFIVRNSGKAEAEAVNVILHFPDDVVLQSKIEGPPALPAAPREPNTFVFGDMVQMLGAPRSEALTSLLRKPGAGPNPNAPRIRRGNSIEIRYGPADVRHRFGWRPDPVWIVLPEKGLQPFDVTYVLSARNLPEVVEGTIRITPSYTHVGPWLPVDDDEENA